MIKAVSIDLDGIYFTADSWNAFKEILPTEASTEEIDYVFHRSSQMTAFKEGMLNEEQFWNFAKTMLHIYDSTITDIEQLIQKTYVINTEIKSYLHSLRKKGIKTCICSNNFPTRVRALHNAFQFSDDFDVQIFSYEAHALTSDQKIFKSLMDAADLLPEEILHTDDTADTLSGATELGIQTLVFTDNDQFKREVGLMLEQ